MRCAEPRLPHRRRRGLGEVTWLDVFAAVMDGVLSADCILYRSSVCAMGRSGSDRPAAVCPSPRRPSCEVNDRSAGPAVCFGMTTPATLAGKIFLIFYGMLGCAGTILFFNLFLERIITLLAVVMRAVQERRLRRSGLFPPGLRRDRASPACRAGSRPSTT
ncbi:hypothetical protein COCON_G00225920 [Conger conger]|uniref:Uncharacterized protein n=1 Tax=Conger conger TaxID=82655 RepID=A0A9Q1CW57_CONCO|nr:hypothetical protein COCON_G00225920 [Conger conger]